MLKIFTLVISIVTLLMLGRVYGHGDVQPQPVDIGGLERFDEWLETNPYVGNEEAIEIGSSAYNQNCARCHGLGCLLYTSPSPRDQRGSRMPSSA